MTLCFMNISLQLVPPVFTIIPPIHDCSSLTQRFTLTRQQPTQSLTTMSYTSIVSYRLRAPVRGVAIATKKIFGGK